jgi:hypothetical protein
MRELNNFGTGDVTVRFLGPNRPKNAKISGPAFAGLPFMAILT